MTNTLTLTQKQVHFLKENRQDPITGDSFQMGDKIVFCAECKSAFLSESWEYMGNRHCTQSQTLTQIPETKNLEFKKAKKEVKYIKKMPSLSKLFFSWAIDTSVWLILNGTFWHFLKESIENPSIYYKLFAIFTLLLKDNNLTTTSLGKVVTGISVVYLKNNRKVNSSLLLLRHLLSAFSLGLFLFTYEVKFIPSIVLLLFLVCILDFILQLDTSRKMIDYILGTAIRQNNEIEEIDIPFQNRDIFSFSDYQDPTSLEEF